MVTFHSYVGLPEGNIIILEMDEANQKHTASSRSCRGFHVLSH